MLNGIDVSVHNGKLDWNKIKASGIQFAILRTGFGINIPKQRDGAFEANYLGAKGVGLLVGCYHYSYAKTVAEAIKEAEFVLDIIKGKQFELPIYFDIEEKSQVDLGKRVCTEIVKAFCTRLEQAGYWAGVYTFDSFFATNLDPDIQKRYACWVASVENRKPVSCTKYGMWQYSWKGKINGSSAETDMNYCYIDYPKMIKDKKLNGFTASKKYIMTISDIDEKDIDKIKTFAKSLGYATMFTAK